MPESAADTRANHRAACSLRRKADRATPRPPNPPRSAPRAPRAQPLRRRYRSSGCAHGHAACRRTRRCEKGASKSVISATRTPPTSAERVDDGDALDLATVAHLFEIEFTASKGASRRDDDAVPVGKPVRRLDFQCAGEIE